MFQPAGHEWGIPDKSGGGRGVEGQDDSKSSPLIKLPTLLLLRSCSIANRQGVGRVLGLETSLAERKR